MELREYSLNLAFWGQCEGRVETKIDEHGRVGNPFKRGEGTATLNLIVQTWIMHQRKGGSLKLEIKHSEN